MRTRPSMKVDMVVELSKKANESKEGMYVTKKGWYLHTNIMMTWVVKKPL